MITEMPRIAIAVRDMDQAIDRFRNALGLGVVELPGVIDSLGIRIAMCSGTTVSHIELMAPEQHDRPQSQSLNRFMDRRGEGLFAMMFYAPDPDEEASAIGERGLPALPLLPEAGGRDFHPKGTGGVLIRIYPTAIDAMIEEPLDKELGSLDQRPSGCGLSGIRAVQIVVPDLEAALAIYRDQFGLPAEVRPPNAEGQLAVCTPPSGSRLELLTPSDPHSKTGRFLQEQGSGLFAIVHESEDAEASARSIQAAGIDVEQAAEDLWDIDPSTTFGAQLRIRSASSS